MHERLLELGSEDMRDEWSGAVWLPVWQHAAPPPRLGYLWTDTEQMQPLLWTRVVLFDVDTKRPLVFYDFGGGLRGDEAATARKHFSFLRTWDFKLNRCGVAGCLWLDGRGAQRMEMLGIHSRGRNEHVPPERARPGLLVANKKGDLDAYVVHLDHPAEFANHAAKGLWNALSRRMHAVLPAACGGMVGELAAARVRERLYTAAAQDVVSDDLLVNNVGVSSSYQSPPHLDKNNGLDLRLRHQVWADGRSASVSSASSAAGYVACLCSATRG